MTRLLVIAALLGSFATSVLADAETNQLIQAAIDDPSRPDGDVIRDANRRPLETLTFFGLEKDMRVIEIIPSGGWYTRILAPVLREEGELLVAIGTRGIRDLQPEDDTFAKIRILDVDFQPTRDNPFGLIESNQYDFGVTDVDMVLTFRNLHNLTPAARQVMNQAAFDALRSGGIYGVVDHTARHMEPLSQDNRRRLDPVTVIHELETIGFEFVAYSDLHYHPDDKLTLEVGDKSVTGQTDRFTLKFRKR